MTVSFCQEAAFAKVAACLRDSCNGLFVPAPEKEVSHPDGGIGVFPEPLVWPYKAKSKTRQARGMKATPYDEAISGVGAYKAACRIGLAEA